MVFCDAHRIRGEGRGGDDRIGLGEGDDLAAGDAQTLEGTARGGDDRLLGGAGQDFLVGDALGASGDVAGGRDRLFGGADDDLLIGDFASAESGVRYGADLLDGGPGDDQLYGDAIDPGTGPFVGGRDLFRFGPSSGLDTVLDLELGKDILDFRGFGGDPAGVRYEDLGAAVRIDLDGTDASIQEVVLIGVALDAVLRELDRTILF